MKTSLSQNHRAIRINPYAVLLIIAWTIFFLPTFMRLSDYGWRSADYDHAFYVMPVFLFLLWRKRHSFIRSRELSIAGTMTFIAGLLAYFIGVVQSFMFLEALSICIVTAALLRLELNDHSWRTMRFPLFYLLLLVPPPAMMLDALTMPLKQISMMGAHGMLSVLGIPTEVFGVVLQVGTHQMFIADACSGFRSIITLVALSSVYLYFQPLSRKMKTTLLISVVPIAIAANIFRLALTGWIAWHYGHEKAEGFFHSFSGALLFIVASLLFLSVMEISHAISRKNK